MIVVSQSLDRLLYETWRKLWSDFRLQASQASRVSHASPRLATPRKPRKPRKRPEAEQPNVASLTALFFLLYFLCATQAPWHPPHASIINLDLKCRTLPWMDGL